MTDSSGPATTQLPPALALPPRARRRRQWLLLVAVLAAVVLVVAVAAQRAVPEAPAVATPTPAPRPQARGQVRPVAQARVGTIAGGVVSSLAVDVGDAVGEQQEIARVRGATGTEVITAPIRGSITGIAVHVGDTVLPGATIVTVGDLSRLQVETTDVSEFVLAARRVRPGQRVTLTIDALERQVSGQVRTVALEPVTPTAVTGGDEHYPVTIDLGEVIPELRAGMTVRVLFLD